MTSKKTKNELDPMMETRDRLFTTMRSTAHQLKRARNIALITLCRSSTLKDLKFHKAQYSILSGEIHAIESVIGFDSDSSCFLESVCDLVEVAIDLK